MTMLPKPIADLADAIVDRVMDLIDAEPDPDIRAELLRRAYRQDWKYERIAGDPSDSLDGGRAVVGFGELREYVIPLVRVGPRPFDA